MGDSGTIGGGGEGKKYAYTSGFTEDLDSPSLNDLENYELLQKYGSRGSFKHLQGGGNHKKGKKMIVN